MWLLQLDELPDNWHFSTVSVERLWFHFCSNTRFPEVNERAIVPLRVGLGDSHLTPVHFPQPGSHPVTCPGSRPVPEQLSGRASASLLPPAAVWPPRAGGEGHCPLSSSSSPPWGSSPGGQRTALDTQGFLCRGDPARPPPLRFTLRANSTDLFSRIKDYVEFKAWQPFPEHLGCAVGCRWWETTELRTGGWDTALAAGCSFPLPVIHTESLKSYGRCSETLGASFLSPDTTWSPSWRLAWSPKDGEGSAR